MNTIDLTKPFILDGATGTELAKLGYDGSVCAEAWILDHPDTIKEIQSRYIEAGSNAVYAPTFGGSSLKLAENKIVGKTVEMNKALCALSMEVAKNKALVGGDIAPTGQFMEPLGELSFEELVDNYKEQAKALEEAGVSFFIIETMMNAWEARAAILAVRSVSDKPVFVTFTCDKNGRTLSGADVAAILLIMEGIGASAFGLNCSVGPKEMLSQLKRMHEYASIPLIAKPNAGMPKVIEGKTVYNCPPDEFTAYVEEMAKAGVALFGGCCGTEPAHIKALKKKTKDLSIASPAPTYGDKLTPVTEKEIFLLDPDILNAFDPEDESVITVSEDLYDDIDEAMDDEESAILAIRLESEEDLEIFTENQYCIKKPLLLLTEDEEVLEGALRAYQGRAMYKGNIAIDTLSIFKDRYGLIF